MTWLCNAELESVERTEEEEEKERERFGSAWHCIAHSCMDVHAWRWEHDPIIVQRNMVHTLVTLRCLLFLLLTNPRETLQ